MSLGWIEGVVEGAQQDKGIQTNAWFMNENQKWSEFMAQHSNQFLVNDLRAAGLNPMLAYSKNTPMPGPQGQAPAVHSAFRADALLLDAQRRNIDADTQLKLASAGQARAQELFIGQQGPKILEEINQIRTSADLNRVKTELEALEVDKLRQLIPYLVRQAGADVSRKQFGQPSLDELNGQQRQLWDWLHTIGERLGVLAYERGPGAQGRALRDLEMEKR